MHQSFPLVLPRVLLSRPHRTLRTTRRARVATAGIAPAGVLAGLVLSGSALALGAAAPADADTTHRPHARGAVHASPVSATTPREDRLLMRRSARVVPAHRHVRHHHRHRWVATGPAFSGIASWYGPWFEGRLTANGEVFDPDDLTAASRTLPLGSRLRVCLASRCVVVRVNDRGPYVDGRVLDLSRAARDRLGGFGLARVTATPVREARSRHRAVTRPASRSGHVLPPRPLRVPPRAAALPAPVATADQRPAPMVEGMLAGGALLAGSSGLAWLRRREEGGT